jgi:tetratricopeptide (TPR) repeat protein
MYYYNSGSLMQLGYNHFNENDLEGALTYWKNAFEKGNVTTKALAAYDIGLVYEMLDDLDECERWLLKSKELKKYPPVYNYLNIIKKRKTDHLKLDKMLRN